MGDEAVDLAVAVAGHVLYGTGAGGPLIEPRQGDDGKHLVDGPGIGQRLKQGEVAEVLVGNHARNLAQLIGHVLHALGYLTHLAGDAPEKFLDGGAGLQVEHTQREEVERLLAYLQGVVPALE